MHESCNVFVIGGLRIKRQIQNHSSHDINSEVSSSFLDLNGEPKVAPPRQGMRKEERWEVAVRGIMGWVLRVRMLR